ncbi:hypothetical protein F2P81_003310, partial [Scophthalmus maximus]
EVDDVFLQFKYLLILLSIAKLPLKRKSSIRTNDSVLLFCMCVDVYISTATLENNQPCIGHTFCDLAYKHDIIQTYTHNTSPLLDTSELSSVVLFYAVSCCLDQLLNIKQTKPKPDHTLFGFAPHQKQTSVCQSALDRDAVRSRPCDILVRLHRRAGLPERQRKGEPGNKSPGAKHNIDPYNPSLLILPSAWPNTCIRSVLPVLYSVFSSNNLRNIRTKRPNNRKVIRCGS